MEFYTIAATKYGHNVTFSKVDNTNIIRMTFPGYSFLFNYEDENKKRLNVCNLTLKKEFLWEDEDIAILHDYIKSGDYKGFIEIETLILKNEVKRKGCADTDHSFRYLPDLKILFCKKCGQQMRITKIG